MPVATVILAAGAGARMGGKPKALLTLPDRRTFLEAVFVPGAIVVVAEPHAAATGAEARRLGATVVVNPAPHEGMISSIRAALPHVAGADAVVIHPVDHPLADAAPVRAAATRGEIVLPGTPARPGHPVAFGADSWALLASAETARHAIAAWPHVRYLGLPTTPDVDTPEDYDRIKRQGPP